MSDLVKRLRASVQNEQLAEQPGQHRPKEEYLSWQAADEIERLQSILDAGHPPE